MAYLLLIPVLDLIRTFRLDDPLPPHDLSSAKREPRQEFGQSLAPSSVKGSEERGETEVSHSRSAIHQPSDAGWNENSPDSNSATQASTICWS